jgi:hypothetical protein
MQAYAFLLNRETIYSYPFIYIRIWHVPAKLHMPLLCLHAFYWTRIKLGPIKAEICITFLHLVARSDLPNRIEFETAKRSWCNLITISAYFAWITRREQDLNWFLVEQEPDSCSSITGYLKHKQILSFKSRRPKTNKNRNQIYGEKLLHKGIVRAK